jgi:hypothetical protein
MNRCWGDVVVGEAGGGELGHAAFARGEGVESGEHESSRSAAGGDELGARSLGERERTTQRWARSSAARRISRLSARCPARLRAAPRSAIARACSSRAAEPSSTATA